MEFIDTRAHLDFPEFDNDRDEVIASCARRGVSRIINIGASIARSEQSVGLAAQYPCVYATVGIHPHDADSFVPEQAAELRRLCRMPKVVGIGEIGLDYYRDHSRRDNQRAMFAEQAAVAKESGLPLVLHSRLAEEDTLKVLKDFLPIKAVVHCFSGGVDFLEACLDLGFFVSYTCNITYKKADSIRESLKATPLDRLMLETDAPFLPPEGMRGKRNDPSQVAAVAREAARIKGSSVEEIAAVTTANALSFFNLR